jgi:hypothetical protein
VCAVIDEETGKSMDYRDLLKDLKHRETWSRAAAIEFGRLQSRAREIEKGLSLSLCDTVLFTRVATSKVHGVCTSAPVPCLTG